MDMVFWVGLSVGLVQALIGWITLKARQRVLNDQPDLFGEIVVGKTTIKFDKTDLLAVTFSIFVFWAVANNHVTGNQALAAFLPALAGTGLKELFEAWWPKKQ
jgi:hypothetical protein